MTSKRSFSGDDLHMIHNRGPSSANKKRAGGVRPQQQQHLHNNNNDMYNNNSNNNMMNHNVYKEDDDDAQLPFCKVVLQRKQRSAGAGDMPAEYTYTAIAINRTFERYISPLFKMMDMDFFHLIVPGTPRQRLQTAIETAIHKNHYPPRNAGSNNNNNSSSSNHNFTAMVASGGSGGMSNELTTNTTTAAAAGVSNTVGGVPNHHHRTTTTTTIIKARNIPMTTLAECNAGLPIRCSFDWTIGKATEDMVVLYGDPCCSSTGNSSHTIDPIMSAASAGTAISAGITTLSINPQQQQQYEPQQQQQPLSIPHHHNNNQMPPAMAASTSTTNANNITNDNEMDDELQRAQDAELVGFFHSAPIALHWISAEGIVLWANQAGLNVFGITHPETYIGQPILQYCYSPNDTTILVEILQQLSCGHTVKDVPIRFRATLDGGGGQKSVDLLVDTHVQLDPNDNTTILQSRCFIRDDIQRQIREARAELLQEETKRSLQMLDNFMSRSLHHMRSPLHVLQTSMDIVKQHLNEIAMHVMDQTELHNLVEDCDFLLVRARAHVTKAVDMIDDIADLARLDQGQPLRLSNDLIQLKDLGTDIFAHADVPSNVEVALELTGGHGPPFIHSDQRYLKKILCNLVDHISNHGGVNDTQLRTITLTIGHTADTCVFTVTEAYARGRPLGAAGRGSTGLLHHAPSSSSLMDNDGHHNNHNHNSMNNNSSSNHGSTGSLPAIFQRYHQELLPAHDGSMVFDTTTDLDRASDRRDTIVTGINSLRHNSMGMGLSLAYHLVRTLGGDLRYAAQPERYTKFWFSLPHNNGGVLSSERIVFDRPKVRYAGLFKSSEDMSSASATTTSPVPYSVKPAPVATVPNSAVAAAAASAPMGAATAPNGAAGLSTQPAMEPPSVLVVEDVPICAKLLCTILRQFKCSATWVKNGQEAVDLLSKEPDRHSLIFMDLRMPVMDGLTATKIIKKKLQMKTPVVALTGEGGDQIRNECMQIGFDAYCKKPMTREELMKVVQQHTGYVYQ